MAQEHIIVFLLISFTRHDDNNVIDVRMPSRELCDGNNSVHVPDHPRPLL